MDRVRRYFCYNKGMQKAKKTIKAVFVSYFLKIRISGAIIKNEKICKKFPNRLDPPPPEIFQTFLNFRHF